MEGDTLINVYQIIFSFLDRNQGCVVVLADSEEEAQILALKKCFGEYREFNIEKVVELEPIKEIEEKEPLLN